MLANRQDDFDTVSNHTKKKKYFDESDDEIPKTKLASQKKGKNIKIDFNEQIR